MNILSLFMRLCSSKCVMRVAESDNVYFDFFASQYVLSLQMYITESKRDCEAIVRLQSAVSQHYSCEWLVV
jgi:hypothetical protein